MIEIFDIVTPVDIVLRGKESIRADYLTASTDTASWRTVSSPARAPARRSRQPRVRFPCQNRRAERSRSGGDRGTTQKHRGGVRVPPGVGPAARSPLCAARLR